MKMEKFDIYKKTVKINEQEYLLQPLSGANLPKLYKVLKEMNPDGKTESSDLELMKNLSEEVVADVHFLVFQTLKQSYPEHDENKLSLFVSQNLWELFNHVLNINLNAGNK